MGGNSANSKLLLLRPFPSMPILLVIEWNTVEIRLSLYFVSETQ